MNITAISLITGVLGILQVFQTLTTHKVSPEVRPTRILSIQRPFVIAHRGFSMLAPENTLPAFEMALRSHADWVELDYYHTADGIPVCFHDSNLSRTTNAEALFGESHNHPSTLTAEKFSQLDCGSWFSSQYEGTRAPSLEQALEFIVPSGVPLIERKAGDARTLCELLKRRNWVHSVATQSFDWDFIEDCHSLLPDMLVGVLGPVRSWEGREIPKEDQVLSPQWAERGAETGAGFIGWNRSVTPEGIKRAHELGLKVLVYTINDPAEAARLVRMGVDGIITDNPSAGWKGIGMASHSGE